MKTIKLIFITLVLIAIGIASKAQMTPYKPSPGGSSSLLEKRFNKSHYKLVDYSRSKY